MENLPKSFLSCSVKQWFMKKFGFLLFILFFVFSLSLSTSSCRSGYGCESNEQIRKDHEKVQESNKRGKSGLWSKKQRKRMKKNSSKP
jgi:preprotein translocase subunit SecG